MRPFAPILCVLLHRGTKLIRPILSLLSRPAHGHGRKRPVIIITIIIAPTARAFLDFYRLLLWFTSDFAQSTALYVNLGARSQHDIMLIRRAILIRRDNTDYDLSSMYCKSGSNATIIVIIHTLVV